MALAEWHKPKSPVGVMLSFPLQVKLAVFTVIVPVGPAVMFVFGAMVSADPALIRTISATDGTPLPFRMNSM